MNRPRMREFTFSSEWASPSRLSEWYMTVRWWLLFGLCVRQKKKKKERRSVIEEEEEGEEWYSSSHRLSVVSLSICLASLSLSVPVGPDGLHFSCAQSVVYFLLLVARSQEKFHLYPIKTSLSPGKLIACVRVCVRVISGGWPEFGFAAQQKW